MNKYHIFEYVSAFSSSKAATMDQISNKLRKRISRINDVLPSGYPVGLEKELIVNNSFADYSKIPVEKIPPCNLFVPSGASYEHGKARPDAEIPTAFLASAFDGNLSISTLCRANMMLGGPGRLRRERSFSSMYPSGCRIEYPHFNQVTHITEEIVSRTKSLDYAQCWLFSLCALYLDVICCHPFADGNGRVARAIAQASLIKTIGITRPIIPFNAVFVHNIDELLTSILCWIINKDIAPSMIAFATAIEHICCYWENYLSL